MARLGIDVLNTREPEIKATWIERGNPVLQSPDSINVRKALARMEFIVVVDQFMTDTAMLADIILPAKDIFEQSDIIGSYWSPYVQYKPKIIQPPGEVLPETEIYYYLAKKMNLDTSLLPEPGNDNIERWLERRIDGYSYLTLDTLKKGPVLAPGLQLIAWEDMKFETSSGKIELFSEEAKSLWGTSPLPEYVAINQDIDREKYPLTLLTPNTGSRIHSQFGNLKIISGSIPEHAAGLSPKDAEMRKIMTGQKIRLFNKNGEIFSLAKISNRVPSGCVVLPNGIWINEGGGTNSLISAVETDMGHGAAFHDNRVEIEGVN